MSSKRRFQVMLEPAQLEALRKIERETGAPIAAQIRRAIDRWLGDKGPGKRGTRKVR